MYLLTNAIFRRRRDSGGKSKDPTPLPRCLGQEPCKPSKDGRRGGENEAIPRSPRLAFRSPVRPLVDNCPRVLLLLLLVDKLVGGEVGGEEADEDLPVVRQLPVGGGERHRGGVALARQARAGRPVKPQEEEVRLQRGDRQMQRFGLLAPETEKM